LIATIRSSTGSIQHRFDALKNDAHPASSQNLQYAIAAKIPHGIGGRVGTQEGLDRFLNRPQNLNVLILQWHLERLVEIGGRHQIVQ
jgi:hypothetical protein